MEPKNVKITVLPEGPLMAEGTVTVIHKDGSAESKQEKTFFCRCGHSATKPYCDGSHIKKRFKG